MFLSCLQSSFYIISYYRRDQKKEGTRAIISSSGRVSVINPVIYTTSVSVASNSTITAKYKSVISLVLATSFCLRWRRRHYVVTNTDIALA